MPTYRFLLAATFALASYSHAAPVPAIVPAQMPYFSAAMNAKVDALVAQMTLEEKIKFCQGDIEDKAPRLRGSAALERLGIAPIVFYNGPRAYQMGPGTVFPVPIGQGATWNPDLVRRLANVIALESLAGRTDCLEAPQINIIRDPLAGRNFESFTEDPYLNGKFAAAFVRGAQDAGAPATVKGLICYNQETNRNKADSIVGERALREIYYPGFQAAIDAGVMGVMTSPSDVNGFAASTNADIIGTIKKDFGFQGFVLTDWNGVKETVAGANAGTDLSMPGSPNGQFSAPKLMAAVKSGKVSEATITDKVRRLLRAVYFAGRIEGAPPHAKGEKPNEAHYKVAREAAQQSMVLLKNQNTTLPLAPSNTKKIALLGPHVDKTFPGGGSSAGRMIYEVTARQGIEKRFGKENVTTVPFEVGGAYEAVGAPFVQNAKGQPGWDAVYRGKTPGTDKDAQLKAVAPAIDFNWEMASPDRQIINSDNFSGSWTGTLTPPASGRYSFRATSSGSVRVTIGGQRILDKNVNARQREAGIELKAGQKVPIEVSFNKSGKQGADANVRLEWARPDFTAQMQSQIDGSVAAAKTADAAVVCVGLDHTYDTEGYDRRDMQIPQYQVDFVKAIARANPRTVIVLYSGSPIDMTSWADDVPAILLPWYPGNENGNALADILSGDVSPSGKLPISFPKHYEDSPAAPARQTPDKNDTIIHNEGIFVGYRWYEHEKIAPMFAFGHGLSYTQFAYTMSGPNKLNFQSGGASLEIPVTVKNAGTRAGAEVVQLYVSQREPKIVRAPQELKGFERIELAPGESKTVNFSLDRSAFSYWDETSHAWKVDAGDYEVRVAAVSDDIRGVRVVSVK